MLDVELDERGVLDYYDTGRCMYVPMYSYVHSHHIKCDLFIDDVLVWKVMLI